MGSGRLDNKLLGFIGGDIRANIFRLINPQSGNEDITGINCMVTNLDINDGLAKISALVLDTTAMSVVGYGNINLKTEKLKVSINPVPKEKLGVDKLGGVTLSLGELTKPFKLGGTLARPRLALDLTQTALLP